MKPGFRKDELVYFILFAIVSVIPFWLVKYVPSLDGPQHLYNARLITELLKGNSFISQYFTLNPVIVGNSTAHFSMAFLMFICPPWLAEKIVLTLYILGLGLSFRYFIRSIDRSGSLIYLIIFPLGFNSLFLMGYYNFCIAFIPFFLSLGFIKRNELHPGIWEFFWLALLFIGIYVSHAVVFVFTGLIIFIQMMVEICYNLWMKTASMKEWAKVAKKYLIILAAAIPAIYLWIVYFLSVDNKKPPSDVEGFDSIILTLNNLINLKFLVGFNHEKEDGPVIMTMVALAAITLIILFRQRIKYTRSGPADSGIKYEWVRWGTITLVLLLLIFLLPDHMTTGSITIRLNILFIFILVTWISLHKLPKPIIHIILSLILVAFVWHRFVIIHYYKELNNKIHDMESVNPHLKSNSTLFPINCSDNWLEGHFHCYVGVEKPIVNILNPQSFGQMPVVWKFKNMPNALLGRQDLEIAGIIWLEDERNRKDVPVDYIFIIRSERINKVGNAKELTDKINPYYTEVFCSRRGNSKLLSLKEEFR